MGHCLTKPDVESVNNIPVKHKDAVDSDAVQLDTSGVIRYTTTPVNTGGTESAPNIVSPRDIQIAIKNGS